MAIEPDQRQVRNIGEPPAVHAATCPEGSAADVRGEILEVKNAMNTMRSRWTAAFTGEVAWA